MSGSPSWQANSLGLTRAAVYHEFNGPITVEDAPDPAVAPVDSRAGPDLRAPLRPHPADGRHLDNVNSVVNPIDVYTDGACRNNPGPGGWAWLVPGGRWATGCKQHTTNQQMELKAVLEAVRAHRDDPLRIHSDSQYVVHGINNGWYKGWLRRNWLNTKSRPVANRDLWEPLIELWLPRRSDVVFVWIPGHAGNRHNDLADKLARRAADTQQPATAMNSPAL